LTNPGEDVINEYVSGLSGRLAAVLEAGWTEPSPEDLRVAFTTRRYVE
jgi:hypothetical protein